MLVASSARAQWAEGFDSYANGSDINGQGGWAQWDNVPISDAFVTSAFAHSAPHSLSTELGADKVRDFAGAYAAGHWEIRVWTYVPSTMLDPQWCVLLSAYSAGCQLAGTCDWTAQFAFDPATPEFFAQVGPSLVTGANQLNLTAPLVFDAWTEVVLDVDLGLDIARLYYAGAAVGDPFAWSAALSGGPGPLEIDTLDLYANNNTTPGDRMYWDDLTISPVIPGGTTLPDPTELQVPVALDSGPLGNPGSQPAVVYQHLLQLPGAAWCRAYFALIELAPGSLLRVTSTDDGESQELDRFSAQHWGLGSAYLNGDEILIELVAAPNSAGNRIVLQRVGVELATSANCDDGPCGACTPDGRVPSGELWSGRWLGGGCTASIYNQHGCYVSAGHCYTDAGTVLAFDVPLSMNDCTMRVPPVADQFPVIASVRDTPGGGCAPDWRVGKIGPNSDGETHFERYGVFKPLASGPPAVNAPVAIFGYGSSSNPVVNGVQQLTSETITGVFGFTMNYSGGTTTGGTSGAGIVDLSSDEIVGINTCCFFGTACAGMGCRIDQAAFVTARQDMCPITVHAPWDTPFCLNQSQVVVPITICNTSASADSYGLSFTAVPGGSPECAVYGPTVFNLIGPNPVGPIAAGECLTVQVVIGRPAGLTAKWLTACYDVAATSMSSPQTAIHRGSVQDRRDLCTTPIGIPGGDVAELAVNTSTPLSFTLQNDQVPSGNITCRAEAFAADMEPSGAISLDGLPYGVASNQVVAVTLGASTQIDVQVRYRWLEPFELSDLVLSADTDGDGVFEPLASLGMRSVLAQPSTAYCAPQSPGTSNGCLPTISATANPNVAHSNLCQITVSNVEGQKTGLVFYGISGPNNAPWCAGGSSFLCVKAPLQRTGAQNTGGTSNACDGSLGVDWNAYQLAHPLALGNPWAAGSKAYVQGWFRDPPACKTTFLSQALELTYQP